jgi:hypothetical protein
MTSSSSSCMIGHKKGGGGKEARGERKGDQDVAFEPRSEVLGPPPR